jgi:hypothetical protein
MAERRIHNPIVRETKHELVDADAELRRMFGEQAIVRGAVQIKYVP